MDDRVTLPTPFLTLLPEFSRPGSHDHGTGTKGGMYVATVITLVSGTVSWDSRLRRKWFGCMSPRLSHVTPGIWIKYYRHSSSREKVRPFMGQWMPEFHAEEDACHNKKVMKDLMTTKKMVSVKYMHSAMERTRSIRVACRCFWSTCERIGIPEVGGAFSVKWTRTIPNHRAWPLVVVTWYVSYFPDPE